MNYAMYSQNESQWSRKMIFIGGEGGGKQFTRLGLAVSFAYTFLNDFSIEYCMFHMIIFINTKNSLVWLI